LFMSAHCLLRAAQRLSLGDISPSKILAMVCAPLPFLKASCWNLSIVWYCARIDGNGFIATPCCCW
jgi:hypothetical protein